MSHKEKFGRGNNVTISRVNLEQEFDLYRKIKTERNESFDPRHFFKRSVIFFIYKIIKSIGIMMPTSCKQRA